MDTLYKSAFCAGVAEILTIPVCTTKTVYQSSSFNSMKDTVKHIYYKKGIKGFYNGTTPAFAAQVIFHLH